MTQRLTVRLADEAGDWVKDEADRRDRSMAYIVNECVEQQMAVGEDRAGQEERENDAPPEEKLEELAALVEELQAEID